MLYFIGIGPELDYVSERALKLMKKAKIILFEQYTNYLNIKKEEVEKRIGKDIRKVGRKEIEENMEEIINLSKDGDVVIITLGNPLFATTHFYYFIEGIKKGVEVGFIHCPSVFDLVLETGLHPYKFGKIASISFHYSETPYEVLKENLSINSHTLFLLDLDPERGRFMTVKEAVDRLIEIENKRKENIISEDTLIIGCARLGMKDKKIVYTEIRKIRNIDFGKPPYCLIYPSRDLHFTEEEALSLFRK